MSESDAPARLRLFVALTVPEPVKAAILESQDRLRRAVPEQAVRWTKPEQFHLTLRFLGSVAASEVDALASALRNSCKNCGPLQLRAAGIGFFPRPSSPRVIWAGVMEAHERLPGLWAAVQTATNPFTGEEPEKNFTGHVTLGRVKAIRPGEAERLSAEAGKFAQTVFGEWTSTDVELIQSQLSPKGARYTTLAAAPLV